MTYRHKTKNRIFPSNQKPRPKYGTLRASVLHKYTRVLHIYTFSLSARNLKIESPHHLFTTAALRVNKCRSECSQPIGVVMNNRQNECSHGEWRLCTNGNDTVFTVLPHLYEYTESARFRMLSDLRNRKFWKCRICYYGVLSF